MKLLHSPWLTIWIKPRQTVKTIIGKKNNYHLFLLSLLYGFGIISYSFSQINFSSISQIFFVIVATLLTGPFIYLCLSVYSWFVYKIGQCFKGAALYRSVRIAITWSLIPCVGFSLLFFLIDALKQYPTGVRLLEILGIILAIWSFILLLCSLSEVHKFSKWKSFFTLFFTNAIINILLLVTSLLIFAAYKGITAYFST
jgi:hypothetical protein